MTKEKQISTIKETDGKLLNIFESKGEDYAGSEDRLINFKQMAVLVSTLNIDMSTPTGCALYMTLMKVQRISNLMNGNKTPNNESLTDSWEDLMAYTKLAYCTYVEKNEENVQTSETVFEKSFK